MYYVYAMKSMSHKRIYVGLTKNIKQRIVEHNRGKTKSTRFYLPWEIFYKEEYSTLVKARGREIQLKSGFGKEFLKSLAYAPVAHKDRAAVS